MAGGKSKKGRKLRVCVAASGDGGMANAEMRRLEPVAGEWRNICFFFRVAPITGVHSG